jgi:hypothetical protein
MTTQLCCSKCGAKAKATCACGAAYVPAGVIAAKAIALHPEKSNRAIAKETGINESTVREARATAGNPAVERIGLDGKTRHLPSHLPRHDNTFLMPSESEHVPAAAALVEKLMPIMAALKREGLCHVTQISPWRVGQLADDLRAHINESSSPISQAKACELCASEWKIDGTKLNENVIDAVRKTADAWSELHKRLLAAGTRVAESVDQPALH